MAFSLRVFFLLCGISGVFGSCLTGWTLFNNECYILKDNPVSYEDAQKDCRGLGAQLVIINDTNKNFVVDLIEDANGNVFVDTSIDLASQGCGSSPSVDCAYIDGPAGACGTNTCSVDKPYVCVK